jgi:fructokinase
MERKFVVVGLGEILWDLLPQGKILGGAPANVAFHANQLGAYGIPVSVVGKDEYGTQLLNELNKKEIDTNYIQIDELHRTGVVEVTFREGEPNYNITENVAWDNLKITKELLEIIKRADALYFGTLASRSENNRAVINTLVNDVKSSCIRYYDLNIRQNYYSGELIENLIRSTDILKLNEVELNLIKIMYNLGGNYSEIATNIIKMFELKMIVLTMGANGSMIIDQNGFSHVTPRLMNVIDTVGAGDSFSAAIIIGLLNNMDIGSINEYASKISSYVCSVIGGTPILPEELRKWNKN